MENNKDKNNNSSNSLVFGRWPQTKTGLETFEKNVPQNDIRLTVFPSDISED